MKRSLLILIIALYWSNIIAQFPESFSWAERHYISPTDYYKYISPIKNQGDNGPCTIFASVAAVEAMTQIYFNRDSIYLDLAESHIYNYDCGHCGTDQYYALNYIRENGIVDEDSFPYNEDCERDCDEIPEYPDQHVTIPGFGSTSVTTNDSLKLLIMDKGPLIALISGGANILHGPQSPVDHAVLVIGWKYENSVLKWHLKDSWPSISAGSQNFDYVAFDILQYCTQYWFVKPIDNGLIECDGLDCSLFSRATPLDKDEDGFYNWGWDFASKPVEAIYPNLMDFNDGDASVIFRSGSTIYATPYVDGTSGNVCMSGGSRFQLKEAPPGFATSWYISKNAYCFNTSAGNGDDLWLYPNSTCTGKESEITFRITRDDENDEFDNGYAEYKKSFYVNCPQEDMMSYYVLDSYGIAPPKYGDTYYLCPYTYYNIYFNETDPNCSITDLDWNLPYAWSKNYAYNNLVSIYTNDVPDGFLEIIGYTTCIPKPNPPPNPLEQPTLMSIYFAAAECGGYFVAYPNPSEDFVDIDIDKSKINSENTYFEDECLLTIVDKSGTIKLKTKFNGFPHRIYTSSLTDGLYFVNIKQKRSNSTIRLSVKH